MIMKIDRNNFLFLMDGIGD